MDERQPQRLEGHRGQLRPERDRRVADHFGPALDHRLPNAASFSFTGAISGTGYECSLDGARSAIARHRSPRRSPTASTSSGPPEISGRLPGRPSAGQWQIDPGLPRRLTIHTGPAANTKLTVADFTLSRAPKPPSSARWTALLSLLHLALECLRPN